MISITRNQSTKVVGLANLRHPLTGSLNSGPNSAASKSFTYLQIPENASQRHWQTPIGQQRGFWEAAGCLGAGLWGVWECDWDMDGGRSEDCEWVGG